MRRASVKCAAVLTLVLALLSFPALAAVEPPPRGEKWVKVVAGEFRVYSNAGPREARRVATDLVRMRQALGKLTKMKVHSSEPVYVFAFRDERSFAPYRDATFGRKMTFTGVMTTRPGGNFVLLRTDPASGGAAIVYHELIHHFVNSTVGRLPSWLNEGLAEYYQTIKVRDDKVDVGYPNAERLATLRRGSLLPLAQLFSTQAAAESLDGGARRSIFYAQSWALTHYLLVGNEAYRERVSTLIGLLRSGTPAAEAVQSALGVTLDQLEQELHLYLRRPTMQYRTYTLDELAMPAVDEARPVARSEALVALGNLLMHLRAETRDDAETFAREAIREDERSAPAHALLAEVLVRKYAHEDAAREFERAIALGSDDAQVILAYASWFLERNVPVVSGREPSEQLLAVRKLLERATVLAPESSRAFELLGTTYLFAGDPAGIPILEKSVALAPGNMMAAVKLSNLYRLSGRPDQAEKIVRRVPVTESSSPLTKQAVQASTGRPDLERAGQLAQEGKIDEALVLLRKVRDTTSSSSLKDQVEQLIRELEKPQPKRDPYLDVLLAVDEQVKQGRYADALRLIDATLPEVKDPSTKRHFELRRESVVRDMKRK